jgi:hypothetical protein
MKHTKVDARNNVELDDLGDEYDSLDDASRRALLAKLKGIGMAAVPVSILLLDADKARAQTGSNCEEQSTFDCI